MKDLQLILPLLLPKNSISISHSRLSTMARWRWGFDSLSMMMTNCHWQSLTVKWVMTVMTVVLCSVWRWVIAGQLERDAWRGSEGGSRLLHRWHLHHIIQVPFDLPRILRIFLREPFHLYQNKLNSFSNYLQASACFLLYIFFFPQGCCLYVLHAMVGFP